MSRLVSDLSLTLLCPKQIVCLNSENQICWETQLSRRVRCMCKVNPVNTKVKLTRIVKQKAEVGFPSSNLLWGDLLKLDGFDSEAGGYILITRDAMEISKWGGIEKEVGLHFAIREDHRDACSDGILEGEEGAVIETWWPSPFQHCQI